MGQPIYGRVRRCHVFGWKMRKPALQRGAPIPVKDLKGIRCLHVRHKLVSLQELSCKLVLLFMQGL
jgi:hypothetical protein